MAEKIVPCGTILEWDPSGGSTYVAVSLIRNVTPGNRVREEAEGGELGDCGLDVPVAAREGQAEVSFTQYWEPGDTEHETIDTAFGDTTKIPTWRITYPHGTNGVTEEFEGYLLTITPETLEPTNVMAREVTIRRTSDITRTVLP